MSNLKSYNIGVIGAGWIAKAHMGFLQETGRANITWIAARNPDNLEKVRSDFDIPNKTHDYHDILKDPAIEYGFFLNRHLIDVLDGNVQPVVTLETAKKHMEIIFTISALNERNN